MKKKQSENVSENSREDFDFYRCNPFQGIWRSLGALAVVMGIIFFIAFIGCLFWRRDDLVGSAKLLFSFYSLMMIGLTIFIGGGSYVHLRKVERAVGKRYKDRTDFALPEHQREWFTEYSVSAGFQVFHRNYFREITYIGCEREPGDRGSGSQTYYKIFFIDCNGKKGSFRLNHDKKELYRFAKWYGREGYRWKDIMEEEF